MNPDELDRLIHRYFEGELSPEEEGLLWSVVRIDPAAADRFVELSELESALVESLRAEEAAPPEVVAASNRGSRRRTRVLPSTELRRPVWPLLFAAGLMLAFLAVLIQSAGRPQPREVAVRPEPPVRVEPPPPALPEERVAPRPAPEPRPLDPPAPLVTPPAPLPPPTEPRPAAPKPPENPPPAPVEKPPPVVETKIVEAKIEKVEGDVVDGAGAVATAGQAMTSGDGLEVRGAKGSAVVSLADGSRVELRPDTRLDRILLSAGEKRFVLSRGVAASTVAKQPLKMTVVFQTPHADVTVLGTKLTVEIGKDSTRVDVQEGRVRFSRRPDGAVADITAGRYAVAGKGPAPVARPIPVVRSFQDGVAPSPDYSGTRDTWISSAEPAQNFATGNQLRLQRTASSLTSLVKWDLSSIPAGSRVVSAELTFWVTGKLDGSCRIHNVARRWDESLATWRFAGPGPWAAAGALHDSDRGSKPVGLLAPGAPGFTTVALNELGVLLVQDWVNDRTLNNGILIAGPDANEWGIESRETALPERRPKLTVTFISAK